MTDTLEVETRLRATFAAVAATTRIQSDRSLEDLPVVPPNPGRRQVRGVFVAAASTCGIVIVATVAFAVLRGNSSHHVKTPTAQTTAVRPEPSPTTLASTGPADPRLINALASELPDGYRLQSSAEATRGNGLHFEEAIFADASGHVASATVFDLAPGESFDQFVAGVSVTASRAPGIYLAKRTTFNSEVVAKLRANRVLTLSSSVRGVHEPNARPFSESFLLHAAANLAARV